MRNLIVAALAFFLATSVMADGFDDRTSGAPTGTYAAGGTDVALADGGTNKSITPVAGGICWIDADSFEETAAGTSGYLLQSGGAGTPTWTQSLASGTTLNGSAIYAAGGTDVALLDGGTNASLTAVNGGVCYSTASAIALSAAGSSGQLLRSAGTSAPTWTTQTFPATCTANQLDYCSATNTQAGLTSCASGVIVTDGSSVPSCSSTLPAVTVNGTLSLANAETISNGTNGQIKLAATGATNNEDLSVDLETTSNVAALSSSTGVTTLSLGGSIGLIWNNGNGSLTSGGAVTLPTATHTFNGTVNHTGITTHASTVTIAGEIKDVGTTCTTGEIMIDTGGATVEFCVCTTTNTIRCIATATTNPLD